MTPHLPLLKIERRALGPLTSAVCALACPAMAQVNAEQAGSVAVGNQNGGGQIASDVAQSLIAPQPTGQVFADPAIGQPQTSLSIGSASTQAPISVSSRILGFGGLLTPGCTLAPLGADGVRGRSNCPFADFSTGLGVTTQLEPIESRVYLTRSTRSPWTSSSLIHRAQSGWSDESSSALVGFTVRLFDGRFNVSSDVALAETWQAPIAAADFSPLKRASQHSGARWHRIEGTPIDRPNLSVKLTADFGKVGDTFPIDQGFLLQRNWVMPGSRLNLSSVVKLGSTRFSLAGDRFASSYGSSRTERFGFSSNGWSLDLTSRRFELKPSTTLGLAELRTRALTISLSIEPEAASSGLLVLLGKSALFPRRASLMLRRGEDDYARGTGYDRQNRLTWDFSATWETRLGETTLGYSYDRRAPITPGLSDRMVRTAQFEHMIRRGGWRLGGDVMSSTSNDASPGGFDDRSLMFGATLAYQRRDGPEFRLRLGHDQSRMRLNDRSYLSRDRGFQISATLDLSRYLQKHLKRDDLRLRAEFRKSLFDSTELLPDLDPFGFEPLEWRRDRNVFQLSFGMKI